ncbi:MAG TPA: UbiD family decarboxylase [Ramlibacter sp.]|uniref:UbiD family decarboxylase n=1 Tax=Ramlibacter sp. TaxID=1917967 RepID=UPI002B9BDB87|nr:UbiD family decarboxylase [Ramlibacter sp.]HVZ44106.1 UbiD family decarboxylase [Ramlibacter sp.]
MKQNPFTLRAFLNELEQRDPSQLLRVRRPVELDYDSTAVVMGLEARGRSPVVWFDKVGSSPFPVVTNVFGSRSRYAQALGVQEDQLTETWAARNDGMLEPVLRDTGPIHDVVLTGDEVDLGVLPIMTHFTEDAGRYITNAIVVANDPDTGVRNASFHRMQVKGRDLLGTSLHSRRHLWNYAQRAEERGEDLPIAIVIGAHPLFTFGGLWKGPIGGDEYSVVGGLMGEPLEIVRARTVPIDVPAHAEFVLEGRLLAGRREPEGPFAEFTGYASERSTQNVVQITAITHRRDAIYQDIVPGISDEHTSLLAVPAEARLLKTLRQQFPNATAVAYPKSGTCRFHAYIALRRAAAGQARNAAAVALGDDLSLKLVVVVDDDVDVRNDSDVLWAMATRMQASDDIDVIRNAMGAILDPSNNAGLTSKMMVDATRPAGGFPRRHTIPEEANRRIQDLLK